MKIFLTGMTAAQNPSSVSAGTFADTLNRMLLEAGHDVTWAIPSVLMGRDLLAEYDSVIVGLAPLTSITAHRAYGALSVIDHAAELGTLSLFIDAPEPRKVWAGIRACAKNPDTLTKPFYSKRSEFRWLEDGDVESAVHNAVDKLFTSRWPNLFYPAFPWTTHEVITTWIPTTHESNVYRICIDLLNNPITSDSTDLYTHEYNPIHAYTWKSDYPDSKWTQAISGTLRYPITNFENPLGYLISLQGKDDPWWSPDLMDALNRGIPVVTEWTLSSELGPEWSLLAYQVEELAAEERKALAAAQRASYLSGCAKRTSPIELVNEVLAQQQKMETL